MREALLKALVLAGASSVAIAEILSLLPTISLR